MDTDEGKTGNGGKVEKRVKIKNPLDALPKDKGWAWMALVGGFVVNTIIAGGCFKSFGVIFTAVQDKYQASSASISKIPAILLALALGISAPTNLLATRFGTRNIVVCGGLLATAGFLLSAMAEVLSVLYLTYGVFIGVGLGLSYAPSVVAVGQYFDKKRATANGVSFAGSGLGSFVLPSLIRFALDAYGLNGALLLMGGMSLNICVCGMLFRPPEFYFRRYILKQDKRKMTAKEGEKTKQLAIDDANEPETDAEARSNQDAGSNGANPVANTEILQEIHTSDDLSRKYASNTNNGKSPVHVAGDTLNGLVDKSETCFVNEAFSAGDVPVSDRTTAKWTDVEFQSGKKGTVSFVDVKFPSTGNILGNGETKSETKSYSSRWCFNSFRKWITCVDSKKERSTDRRGTDLCRMMTNPVVMLYATVAAVSNSCFLCTFIMVPPHAEQLHFASTSAALLVSIMGVFDFVARVGVGWFADKNFIKKKYILHASMALGGLTLCLVPLLRSYESLAITLALFASSGGTFVLMLPTLLAESLGIEHLPVAYGLSNLFVGCACLVAPTMLGILKDVTGRWDASFFACGSFMIAVTLLYFVEQWTLRVGRRRLDAKRSSA